MEIGNMVQTTKLAVDYGTTRSAMAWKWPSEEKINPLKWSNISGYVPKQGYPSNEKAPTVCYYYSTGEFEIAHKALNSYSEDMIKGTPGILIEKAKLNLQYPSIHGIRTIDVVSDYLKTCVELWQDNYLSDPHSNIPVQFYFTVPASWTFKEKVIMREAVRKIKTSNNTFISESAINFVLEPEAGLFSFIHFAKECKMDIENKVVLVLDAGGGTNDLTVHKILTSPLEVEEVCAGIGDRMGSSWINHEVIKWFKSLLKEGVKWDNLRFEEDVENKKCNLSSYKDWTFAIESYRLKNIDFKDSSRIKENGENNLFTVTCEEWKQFMDPPIKSILNMIEELLKSCGKVDFIFLVGGFSNSHILKCAVEKQFIGKAKILKPLFPESHIARGAVLYDEKVIKKRVLRSKIEMGNIKQRETVANEKDIITKEWHKTMPLPPVLFDDQKLLAINFYETNSSSETMHVGQAVIFFPSGVKKNTKVSVDISLHNNEILVQGKLDCTNKLTETVFKCIYYQNENVTIHFIFVVDNSGSMAEGPAPPTNSPFYGSNANRLGMVFDQIYRFVDEKQNEKETKINFKCSLIKFNSVAEIVFNDRQLKTLNLMTFLNFRPMGLTHFTTGLTKLDAIISQLPRDVIPVVFFMSDGENNDRGSPEQVVLDMSHKFSHMCFNTIFIGDSSNKDTANSRKMLQVLALHGNGLYSATESNLSTLHTTFDYLSMRLVSNKNY